MLTKQQQLEEYAKCIINPAYAIESFLETFDKTQEGFVPFKLFEKQLEIIDGYENHRFNIVAKPRQAGVSTTTAAYAAVKVGFADPDNPEKILILANKQDMAQEFLGKIKDFLAQLPRWIWGSDYYGTSEKEKKSIFITDSKKHLILPNKSEVKAVATSKDALRGYTPTHLIMDEAAFIDDGEIVFGAALTSLGCLVKDTLILTNDGLVELDELVTEKEKIGFTDLDTPHKVCNMDGNIVDATQTFVSEYATTYRILTKTGIELEGSFKHPLLVNDEWVKMEELKVGDEIKVGYNQNIFGNHDIFEFDYKLHPNEFDINIPRDLSQNLNFVYLMGLFVAEGNFQSRGITITNVGPDIVNFLLNDDANLGKAFTKVDDRHYSLSSTKLIRWMDAFGLKKHNAKNKEIPLPILKMSKDVISAFLQGMFDGDGMSTYKEIKYSSTSKKLIKRLQTILLNYGIKSHIHYVEEETSESSIIPNKSHVCKLYNLFIYSNHALNFYDNIGFRLKRKQVNRNKLINKKVNSRFVEVTQQSILKILKKYHIPKYKVRFLDRFFNSKYARLSYDSLGKLIDYIKHYYNTIDGDLDELLTQKYYNENYFYDEIVDIIVSKDYTYDLHVPETHSFISNSVISHNTGGHATLISCVVDDTFVFTDKGIRQIKDFIPTQNNGPHLIEEYHVLGKNKLRSGNIFHNNGLVNTIKIKTVNSELEGSYPHKLYAYSNGKYGWVKMEDLKVGDYVAHQYGMGIWGNDDKVNFKYEPSTKEKNSLGEINEITNEMAYFLGLYLAEGSVYKSINNDGDHIGTSITLTCYDDMTPVFNGIGLQVQSYDNLHYTVGSKELGAFMEYLGFNLSLHANDKVIPNKLLSLSKEKTKYLLRGIFDGDGFSRKDKGYIGIGLSSEKLIKQIRVLLNNFGILTDYFVVNTKPTKLVKSYSMNYRIQTNAVSAKIFYKEIGFGFERKQVNEHVLNDKKIDYSDPRDIIPNSKELVKEIYREYNGTQKHLKDMGVYILPNGSGNKSRMGLLKLIDYVKDDLSDELLSKLNKHISYNLKWCKIKEISYHENYTYDFSLPNDNNDFWAHSVIYNGILGHQTPNGYDKLYYKTYDGAQTGDNDFNIIEMRWYQDPRYNKGLIWTKGDETITETIFTVEWLEKRRQDGWKPSSSWYEAMCRGMNNDKRMIAQELDVSFVGSGGNVIDDEYIMYHEENYVQEPEWISGKDNEFWIWKKPIEGHQYLLSSDVSRGDGEDSSTFTIIDFTTMEQVMEYKGKIQPDLLAPLIDEYASLYNAYTVVDITGGLGVATVLKLLEIGFKNLHYDDPRNKILSSRADLQKFAKDNGRKIPGLNVNSIRLPMIALFEQSIRENLIKVRSKRLISEMRTFVYRSGRPDHMVGYHDDLLMAMAMGLWVLEHAFKNLEKLEKQTKAMLNSWTMTGGNVVEDKTEAVFVSKDKKVIRSKPKFHPTVSKNMQDPRGEYLWLFSGMR